MMHNITEVEYGLDISKEDWISRPQTMGLEQYREEEERSKFYIWEEYTIKVDDYLFEDLTEDIKLPAKSKPKHHNIQYNKYTKKNYHTLRNNKQQYNHRRR